jgi:hypothetical protein
MSWFQLYSDSAFLLGLTIPLLLLSVVVRMLQRKTIGRATVTNISARQKRTELSVESSASDVRHQEGWQE